MKKMIITTIFWTILTAALGQEAKKLYEKGLEKARKGKLEEAIELFTKSIELHSGSFFPWYHRGHARFMLNYYEQALQDFDQTIKLGPKYKNAYLQRGLTKKHLTDYEGALSDYSWAIKLDSNFADAYYYRGLVYELFGNKDQACPDFEKAKQVGMKTIQKKIDRCEDTTKIVSHSILYLTQTSDDEKYGFSPDKPIKVGSGPDGGPANQRTYLDLLRDPQGRPVKYKRVGSCCEYKSNNSYWGVASLDQYEIKYLDERGQEKTGMLYMSFYDYEEPQILKGFRTVSQK